MNTKNYLKFDRYIIYVNSIQIFTWVALASFTIVAKSNLGQDILPIMEMLVYLMGIIGAKYAFAKLKNYSFYILLDNFIETLFIVFMLILLFAKPDYSGYAIYFIIVLNTFTSPILREKKRQYEDKILLHLRYKNILESNRKVFEYMRLISGILGASLSVLLLTGLKADIITFAIGMQVLTLLANLFQYLLWFKYLR